MAAPALVVGLIGSRSQILCADAKTVAYAYDEGGQPSVDYHEGEAAHRFDWSTGTHAAGVLAPSMGHYPTPILSV